MVVSTPSITACGWTAGRGPLVIAVFAALLTLPGCMAGYTIHIPQSLAFWDKSEPKVDNTLPEDAYVMRGGEMVPETTVPTLGGDFEGAKLLFQQKEYAKAAPIFYHIAENMKNPLPVLESARWYEAECYYKQAQYPDASSRYIQLLNNFPSAAHGEEARKRLFDIANYWLDETREQMEAAREKREGKRWFVWPIAPVHFEDSKPLLDIEGHSIKLLEAVYMTDPRGQLGEKALFYLGSIKFYREDWKDADHYFYQLVQNYPNSAHAPKALQLSILCKEISQGGYAYDGRRLQEARDLIKMAKNAYPELSRDGDQFLTKQMVQIHAVQAEKDYEVARFWDRTGHPGSAYFSYEIVKRRYPGTPFAEKAENRMVELRGRAEEEQRKDAGAAPHQPQPNEAGPPPRQLQPGQPLGGPGAEQGPAPRTLPQGMMEGMPPR